MTRRQVLCNFWFWCWCTTGLEIEQGGWRTVGVFHAPLFLHGAQRQSGNGAFCCTLLREAARAGPLMKI